MFEFFTPFACYPFRYTEMGNRCLHKSFSNSFSRSIPYSDWLRSSSKPVNHHQIISEFAYGRGVSILSRYICSNLSHGNRNRIKGNLKYNRIFDKVDTFHQTATFLFNRGHLYFDKLTGESSILLDDIIHAFTYMHFSLEPVRHKSTCLTKCFKMQKFLSMNPLFS